MKRLLLLAALVAGLQAAPAQASNYPTEIAVGPTLGLSGAGLAWRQFALPWLGFQLGGNTWGIGHFAGGALLISPYHDERRQRIYMSAGIAMAIDGDLRRQEFFPALGIGASQVINDRWTFFTDVSLFTFRFWGSTDIPFLAPQIGFLYTF